MTWTVTWVANLPMRRRTRFWFPDEATARAEIAEWLPWAEAVIIAPEPRPGWIGRLLCRFGIHRRLFTGQYGSGFGFDRFYRTCGRCGATDHVDSTNWLL